MKHVFFAVVTLLTAPELVAQTPAPPSLQQALNASRWQQRVLLVGAPTAGQPDFKRQRELLAAVPDQLRERDIKVISVIYNQSGPVDIRFAQQLGLRPPAFGVVLIGKDGGAKRTSARPLVPADLFGTVDKMPMRRQEMQRGR